MSAARSIRLDVAVVGLAALAVAIGLTGERIAFGGGFGMDGQAYGHWAQDFRGTVLARDLDDFYVQRVFPSLVVWLALSGTGAAKTAAHVVDAFAILNGLAVVLTAWLWCRIAAVVALSPRATALGAVGLLVNFATLKWLPFYPVLTDGTALALGTAGLYFWLTGRTLGIAATALLGAFTWYSQLYVGMLLILFPYEGDGAREHGWSPRTSAAVAALVAVATVAAVAVARSGGWVVPGVTATAHGPLVLSVAIVAATTGYAVWALLVEGGPRRWPLGRSAAGRIALALAVLVAAKAGQYALSDHAPRHASSYVRSLPWLATARPAVAFVSHAVFLGPIIVLAIVVWQRVARSAARLGTGAVLVLAVAVVQAFDSESRHLINFAPLLVLCVAAAVDRPGLRTWHVAALAAVGLATSKAWLTIGPFDPGAYLEFPAQRFYMSQGPWMSPGMYALQGTIVAVALVLGVTWAWQQRASGPAPASH